MSNSASIIVSPTLKLKYFATFNDAANLYMVNIFLFFFIQVLDNNITFFFNFLRLWNKVSSDILYKSNIHSNKYLLFIDQSELLFVHILSCFSVDELNMHVTVDYTVSIVLGYYLIYLRTSNLM